jgi:hypothetical protein
MTSDDFVREYAARCVVVAQRTTSAPTMSISGVWAETDLDEPTERPPMLRHCPHCGQPMVIADTPAQDAPKDVSADRGPAPVMPAPAKTNESWRDRPPLL